MDHRRLFLALSAAVFVTPALADPGSGRTVSFAVMRNGSQIGTNNIKITHEGPEITWETVTHIAVGFGGLTLYRYDQTEMERWADGRFAAMNATTDDNGAKFVASASANDGKVIIHGADNKESEAPSGAIPFNLWNPDLVDHNVTFDPKDGSVQPTRITDRGEEKLVIQGKPRTAHHYKIVTQYNQDVWYDENRQLVQVELIGTDGSTIRYQLM